MASWFSGAIKQWNCSDAWHHQWMMHIFKRIPKILNKDVFVLQYKFLLEKICVVRKAIYSFIPSDMYFNVHVSWFTALQLIQIFL